MKKLFGFILALLCTMSINAQGFYMVGDAVPCGWDAGRSLPFHKVSDTSYEWIGNLVVGNEGFKILTSPNWGADYHPNAGGTQIDVVGKAEWSDIHWEGDDTKWKVSKDGIYKLTIDITGEDNGHKTINLSCEAGTFPVPMSNGVFQIGNAEQLASYASLTGYYADGTKAVLTSDIDFSNYKTTMIGNDRQRFKGNFDGQGHTIKVDYDLNREQDAVDHVALFRFISDATIQNLWVKGAIHTNKNLMGGLVGLCEGKSVLRNIVVDVDMNSTFDGDGTHGGIISVGASGSEPVVENIAFVGAINAPKSGGTCAMIGYAHWGGSIHFKNSYVAGSLNIADGKVVGRNGEYFNENCFTTISDRPMVNDDDRQGGIIEQTFVGNGKLCYLLNGDQSNVVWYQTLGADAYPVPFSTSKQVYANGELNCDGTSAGGELTYSNKSESIIPEHTDVDGWCSVCGQLIKTHLETEDGAFVIASAKDLHWFAEYVRTVDGNANAKLADDIDYTAYKEGYIGVDGAPFKGTFDGQAHTITIDLKDTQNRTGLFAYVNSATIKNLVVDGTVTMTDHNCAGGLGGRSDGDGTCIQNVVVLTDINYKHSNGDATVGGLFANMENQVTIENCAFLGSINTGTAEGNGGIIGWAGGGNNVKIINSYVAPSAYTQNGNSADFARNNPTVTNCYKLDASDNMLTDGTLCALLNGEGEKVWYQGDAYPVPFKMEEVKPDCPEIAYSVEEGAEIDLNETMNIHIDATVPEACEPTDELYIEGMVYGRDGTAQPIFGYTFFEEGVDVNIARLNPGNAYTIEITKIAFGEVLGYGEDGFTPIYKYNFTAQEGLSLSTLNFALKEMEKEPVEVAYTVDPTNGSTVTSLETVTIKFTEDTSVGNGMIVIKKDGKQIARVDAEGIFDPEDWFAPVLEYVVPVDATQPGVYTIEVPEGYFQQQFADVDVPAITLTYTIEAPAPAGEMAVIPSLFAGFEKTNSGVIGGIGIEYTLNGHSLVSADVAEGLRVQIENCPKAIGVSFSLNEMKMGQDAEGTFWTIGKELAVGEIEMHADSYASFDAPIPFYVGNKYQLTVTVYGMVNGEPAEIGTYTYQFNGSADENGIATEVKPNNGETAIKGVSATVADGKYMKNGKIVIVKNGKTYNANGQIVK